MIRVCQCCAGSLAVRREFATLNGTHVEVRCRACGVDGCRSDVDGHEIRRGRAFQADRQASQAGRAIA